MNMRIFAQITKVDVAKREVWGRATQEVVDKAGEIFDYESSKPHFKAWSEGFAKDTDGKSLGNIRSMHGKVAAGKVINIDFNDAEKAIDIGTKIIDDNEWEKVQEGVHTGFSIGGSYEKKWADPENKAVMRFTANPVEISLVDSPCVPTAKFFDVVKADGVVEQKEFKASDAPDLKKFMGEEVWDVSTALQALDAVMYLFGKESAEPGKPAEQVAALAAVVENLKRFIASEIMEDNSGTSSPMALAEASGDLEKAGAKFSAASKEKLGEAHKAATDAHEALGKALGSMPDCWKADTPGDLEKGVVLAEELQKANTTIETLQKRVTELEALPEPPKGVLSGAAVSVSKADDLGLNNLKTASEEAQKEIEAMPEGTEKALAMIKFVHLTGGASAPA
jgi:hypothetical protein